jgi:Holliday junction resolvase RusA-like endonuclease
LDKAERGCDVDAYWKATLDALVRCGLLRHDSPGWAEITPVIYSREPGQKRTIIELEDIT